MHFKKSVITPITNPEIVVLVDSIHKCSIYPLIVAITTLGPSTASALPPICVVSTLRAEIIIRKPARRAHHTIYWNNLFATYTLCLH